MNNEIQSKATLMLNMITNKLNESFKELTDDLDTALSIGHGEIITKMSKAFLLMLDGHTATAEEPESGLNVCPIKVKMQQDINECFQKLNTSLNKDVQVPDVVKVEDQLPALKFLLANLDDDSDDHDCSPESDECADGYLCQWA